jgi:hypothetical protein
MEKIAIQTYSAIQFYQKLSFKKAALAFDKIFIDQSAVNSIMRNRYKNNVRCSAQEKQFIAENLSELDYLFDKGILQEYKHENHQPYIVNDDESKFNNWRTNEYKRLIKKHSKVKKAVSKINIKDWDSDEWRLMNDLDNEVFDIDTRSNVFGLKRKGYKDVFPLLSGKSSFNSSNRKEEVINLLLNQFPTPDENTSWEQIIDFRNDEDSRLKYYSLIHWVNSVSSNNRPISEIEDEYEYLYQKYKKQFALHKMKTSLTTWEMIVAAGVDNVLSYQGLPSLIKNLFSLSKSRISLLEEEIKLPGQEIAYIYKANNTFK